MSDKLIVKLVPESEAVSQSKQKWYKAPLAILLIGGLIGGIGAGVGRSLAPPVLPDKLTPAEAARILQMQKGYAGYTLVKDEGGSGQVGHAIFCPNCATEIAMVNVAFLPPAPPEPGSRMAILLSLAKTAVAVAKTSPKKYTATAPAKIETVN